MEEGKTRAVGASNLTLAELEEFAAECPLAAFQPPYNMLMRQIEADTLPLVPRARRGRAGLLAADEGPAGRQDRPRLRLRPRRQPAQISHVPGRGAAEEPRPGRPTCRRSPEAAGHSVAELVINWTIHQPGITAALCGAKRPDQIRECAGGSGWQLTAEQVAQIERGTRRSRAGRRATARVNSGPISRRERVRVRAAFLSPLPPGDMLLYCALLCSDLRASHLVLRTPYFPHLRPKENPDPTISSRLLSGDYPNP